MIGCYVTFPNEETNIICVGLIIDKVVSDGDTMYIIECDSKELHMIYPSNICNRVDNQVPINLYNEGDSFIFYNQPTNEWILERFRYNGVRLYCKDDILVSKGFSLREFTEVVNTGLWIHKKNNHENN